MTLDGLADHWLAVAMLCGLAAWLGRLWGRAAAADDRTYLCHTEWAEVCPLARERAARREDERCEGI